MRVLGSGDVDDEFEGRRRLPEQHLRSDIRRRRPYEGDAAIAHQELVAVVKKLPGQRE